MTFADHVDHARGVLAQQGWTADDARRDVTVLARWLLDWDTGTWLMRQREPAPADFAGRLRQLVVRRATHEPIAYIIGEREFFGRAFTVTRDVLIPRPETEFVIEEALACLAAGSRAAAGSAPAVVDAGTGSGCLAITLALEHPGAHVIATDISTAALAVARANVHRWGVSSRVNLRLAVVLAGVQAPIDLIVSNPPYVRDDERTTLPPDVVDFEPHLALFAGMDGLNVVRLLVHDALTVLAPGGWLVMEIGAGQADRARQIIEDTGSLRVVRVRPDLQGIPRVVVARRVAPPAS